jgi:nicotinamidase-related amidase
MSKSALLIIDMQNDFVLPRSPACVNGAYGTIDSVKKLLDYFRRTKKPIFFIIREYRNDGSDIEITRFDKFMTDKKIVVPNTDGCKIVDKLKPIEGEYTIIKNRFSGFMNTELNFMLRRLDIS